MDTEETMRDELVSFVREQKHDFLNHLQVIMGNLELNKKEKAVAYLKQIILKAAENNEITLVGNSYLIINLWLVVQKSKQLGVDLIISLASHDVTCKNYDDKLVDEIILLLFAVVKYISQLSPEHNLLKIIIQEKHGEHLWVLETPLFASGGDLYQALRREQETFVSKNLSLKQSLNDMAFTFVVAGV